MNVDNAQDTDSIQGNSAQNNEAHNLPNNKPLINPGVLLRKAREAAHMSLQEVADELHLVSSQIVALEENRYDYFHGEIFCKGYLRAYGKLMGIESECLIDGYTQLRPATPELVKNKSNKKTCPIQSPGKGHSIQYWCIAIVLAIITLLWMFSGSEKKEAASPSLLNNKNLSTVDEHDRSLLKSLKNKNSDLSIEDNDNSVGSVEQGSTSTTFNVNNTESGVNINAQLQNLPVVNKTVSEATLGSTHQSTLESLTQTASNSIQSNLVTDEDILSVSFSADCWIKVTDRDNKVLVAQLKKADDILSLRGQAPFTITLGYARAVSIKYNGDDVPINQNRNKRTAKIVVGP